MEKELNKRESEAVRHIRNWLVHKGYTPSVRELMVSLGYKSPRSAQDILEQLSKKGAIKKSGTGEYKLTANLDGSSLHAQTVNVPLVGTIACGTPVLAEENIEAFIPVSISLARPGHKYYLLRASGDSMNRAGINDGDIVLVRQQPVADPGERVAALIDNEATIKVYHPVKGAIILKPKSTNKNHQPIILTDDFQIQGVVVATIPKFE